jgi:hypothetical protein
MKHVVSVAFIGALLFAHAASTDGVLITDTSGYTRPQLDLSASETGA